MICKRVKAAAYRSGLFLFVQHQTRRIILKTQPTLPDFVKMIKDLSLDDGQEILSVFLQRKPASLFQPFCRHPGFQNQFPSLRDQDADLLAACVKPVDFFVLSLTAAGNGAIKPLPAHLHPANDLSTVSHIKHLGQKIHPLGSFYAQGEFLLRCPVVMEPKADSDGFIHLIHVFLVQPAHMLPEPLFINGADLFQ